MELKKIAVEKIIRTEGEKDGNKWMRVEVVLHDLHSQVETRCMARVQRRVVDSGIELVEGKEYDVQISLGCREWNGKYYNDLSIWQMKEVEPECF